MNSPEVAAMPQLPIDEVLALQSLVMGVTRKKARKVSNMDGKHRFCIYETYGEEMNTGASERFLSVSVGRVSFNERNMRISSLDYDLEDEYRYSNRRELDDITWYADGTCFGIRKVIDNFVEIIDTYPSDDEYGGLIDLVLPNRTVTVRPMVHADLDYRCQDVLDITTYAHNKFAA